MTILIIGSKGFVGSYLTRSWRKASHTIFGCDVGVDYNDAQYFQVDSTNANYEEIFLSRKFEACVNCSGAASVPDSLIHPLRDFALNTQNVFLMLEAIRKHNNSCKFINLSSAAVYGNPFSLPVKESAAVDPVSPYGNHKSYAEEICKEFSRFYGLQTCSVRIFSAYGPGLQKQLFWDLHQRIKMHGKLELMGTGNESRDFIFIQDIVDGLEVILRKGDFSAGVYNLASGRETTIREAVQTFVDCFDESVPFSFSNEVRKGDPLNWRADISKIQALGFTPGFSLQDGLKKYKEWLATEKR